MEDRREINQDDTEYILSHLNVPETLTDPDFLEWLSQDKRLELFEEVRCKREAFLHREYGTCWDIEKEYRRFSGRVRPKSRSLYYWLSAAACVAVIFTTVFVMKKRPVHVVPVEIIVQEIPAGKKSAELTLANGEKVALEDQTLQLRETTGTLITNDKSQQLAYQTDTFTRPDETGLIYNTLKIPSGADYMVRLADGSKVRLNCETTLRFPVEFAKNERRVYLDGEAYFEVKQAKEWPFIVVTDKMDIRVTGTSFNVKSYREEDIIHTTLVSGVVEVAAKEVAEKSVRLKPSQQFRMDKRTHEAQVREVDTDLFTGWTGGMFVFKNNPLEEVMNTLAKWYRIDVFYTSESVKDMHFSANLDRYEHIDRLLEIIRATDKVKVERRGSTVTISWK